MVFPVSKNKIPKSLIQDILGPSLGPSSALLPGEVATQAADAGEPSIVDASLPPDEQAQELVDLYFTLEDPVERDVVFDKLAALHGDSPVVAEFFAAMMDHDEDEYLRIAAATELARRGDVEAMARLEDEVQDPTDLTMFAQALAALGELRGQAYYEPAAALWRDAARESGERREAMLLLEALDTPRAIADFMAWLQEVTDVQSLPDDLVEVAMAAFVRQDTQAALPLLQSLRGRILAAAWEDTEERDELAAFIDEGIALLRPES